MLTTSEKIEKLSLKTILISLGCVAIGIVLLFFTLHFEPYLADWFFQIAEHFCAIVIAVFTLHVISELFLKREFLGTLEEKIDKALPVSFKNIRALGIADIHNNLEESRYFKDRFATAKDTDFFILVMWIQELEKYSDIIVDAINKRRCTVKILIFDGNNADTIWHRANSLKPKYDYSLEKIRQYIDGNVGEMRVIQSRIKTDKPVNDPNYPFQCRHYNEWVSVCLYGSGEELLLGHYLLERFSTEGCFIKIRNSASKLYDDFHNHFLVIWKRSMNVAAYDILSGPSVTTNAAK